MKRKAEITFEIEETTIVRQATKLVSAFCMQCQTPVKMLTPEIAAAFSGFSEREIFRLMEAGKIHFVEAERPYICRNSLENCVEIIRSGSEQFI